MSLWREHVVSGRRRVVTAHEHASGFGVGGGWSWVDPVGPLVQSDGFQGRCDTQGLWRHFDKNVAGGAGPWPVPAGAHFDRGRMTT